MKIDGGLTRTFSCVATLDGRVRRGRRYLLSSILNICVRMHDACVHLPQEVYTCVCMSAHRSSFSVFRTVTWRQVEVRCRYVCLFCLFKPNSRRGGGLSSADLMLIAIVRGGISLSGVLQGCEDRDVLLEEVSRLIRLIRRCPFKPSSSLAVSIVPSSSLDGGRNTAEEEQDARRRGLSGQKRRDCSGHTEDSDGRRHLPASTLVVMYKDGGDGKAMQRGEVEGTARYECLGVCKDVRFLSLALHALYLKGWETPDPRYTTIAQKFRHDAERDLLAYPRNTS